MRLLSRLIPRSITGQITGLVAVSVLLGLGLVATSLLVFFEHSSSDPATWMANLTLQVNAAESPHQAAAIVAVAQSAGMKVRHVRSDEHTSELQSLMRISYAVFSLHKNRHLHTHHYLHTHHPAHNTTR